MVTKPHFVGSAGFPARDASRGWMPRRGARTRATGQGGRAPKQGLIALVTVLATIYNALLAFLAAQGGPATMGIVIAFELLVLLSALGLVASVLVCTMTGLPASLWTSHFPGAPAGSPDEILKMPPLLWKAVERASAVMGIDEDLMRPPALDADGVACP